MKLSLATRYALHAATYLAAQKKDEPVESHIIAHARGISERFLLKVLRPLVSSRVLTSVKGPNGGYRLARAGNDISMLDVLEAVEGPVRGYAPSGKGEKDTAVGRRLDDVCNQHAEMTRKLLGKVKISELAGR